MSDTLKAVREVRVLPAELRAESQGDEMSLVGYASVFGQESQDLGGFKEMVMPGCYTRAIREGQDVKCLFNHDPNVVLGRTKSGTLKLSEDARGLKFRCVMPSTQAARDIHASIKRGDIDQCSFGFMVRSQSWEDAYDKEGNSYPLRKLLDCDLQDVSAVTYPAYLGTSVAARSAVFFPDGEIPEVRSALAIFTRKHEHDRKKFLTLVKESSDISARINEVKLF